MPSLKPRVRPWVFVGGFALTVTAGFVNSLLLQSSFHVPVSHMSGAVSAFGIDLMQREYADFAFIASIILGFLAGAVASGLIIGNQRLRPGRRYGIALMVEGLAFALAASGWGTVGWAAFGCGLQNGLASSYLGLVIRTTHVTGIVTDLGVLIGEALRHRTVRWWKIGLLVTLLVGFAGGGILAVPIESWLGVQAMWLVSGGVTGAGLLYFLHWHRQRPGRSGAEERGRTAPKEGCRAGEGCSEEGHGPGRERASDSRTGAEQ